MAESDGSVDVVEDCREVRCEGSVEMDGSVITGPEFFVKGMLGCEVWGKTDCSADAVDVVSIYSKGVGCEDWVETVEVLGCSGDVTGESWVELDGCVNVGDVSVELDGLVGVV